MTRDEVIALAGECGFATPYDVVMINRFAAAIEARVREEERAARIKAQQETEQLREDLTKRAQQAQKDAYQRGLADGGMSLKLVADIRFALGDDGKRMQDELVEYCKELRRDAERYRWLRNDHAECFELSPDQLDAEIDAAMKTQAPKGA